MENKNMLPVIPKEKLEFANLGDRLTDKKFDSKPISYFHDAWIRFRKNKASIAAAIIIILIVLYALLVPLFSGSRYDGFLDTYYRRMGPRNLALSELGIFNGSTERSLNERQYMLTLSLGVAADGYDGVTVPADEATSKYSPVLNLKNVKNNMATKKIIYTADIDTYLEVGFLYKQIEQAEYDTIRAWEAETGLHVLYPLIDTSSEFFPDPEKEKENANYWYKADAKLNPLDENGNVISYSADMVFSDNYKRDANGDLVYYEYTGGGTTETAQYKVRILYYNYYVYKNGFEPEYFFGTDSQGYDLAYRMAQGIQLSLLVAIFVSVINFVLGAMYGAVEGYYGGAVDMVLERISDILNGVPFIVVATLFQIHLAQKVGAIPSLLFAFVVTGWIGTASRVRTQFYRFKNSEYVMAARTLGASDNRIIWKHIFPNSLGTIITSSALVIPSVIFSESMLSFLGIVNLGGAEITSLGTLLSDASTLWTKYPHLMIFPAIVISLLMICFNLFGNGLRDAFNPSLRGVED